VGQPDGAGRFHRDRRVLILLNIHFTFVPQTPVVAIMTFIERFKSLIEQQLEGWGPDELVSVGAELSVAACVVVPLFAAGLLGRWAIRKYGTPHGPSTSAANFSPRDSRLSTAKH
jgi:hypothetical protein